MLNEAFRSLINFGKGDGHLTKEDLVNNFRVFEKSKVRCEEASYAKLYHFLRDHYQRYQDMPDVRLADDFFRNTDPDHEVLAALATIKTKRPWDGSNYRRILEGIRESQNLAQFMEILMDGQEIAKTGKKEGKGKAAVTVKGLKAAVDHVSYNARELLRAQEDYKLEGQIRSKEDTQEMKDHYERMEKKSEEGFSVLTGLKKIDKHRGGIKPTELVLIAAYTGQFKTTLMLNIAYRAVITGFNVAFVSLEMGFEEMRRRFTVLHTCHPKFLQTKYAKYVFSIKTSEVEFGGLSPEQKEFYFYALNDLTTYESYGEIHMWQPDMAETTVRDIEVKFEEIENDLRNRGRTLDIGCVDYLCLLSPERGQRNRDEIANYTTIVKQARRLTLTFNGGQGLRLISPWQVNRKGYEEAKKAGGRYDLPALAAAAEAERSATLVMAIYVGEEQREKDNLLLQCLKDRSNKPFAPFDAAVTPKSGFIYDIANKAEQDFVEIDMSKLRNLEELK